MFLRLLRIGAPLRNIRGKGCPTHGLHWYCKKGWVHYLNHIHDTTQMLQHLLNTFPRTRLLVIRRIHALIPKWILAMVAYEIDALSRGILFPISQSTMN